MVRVNYSERQYEQLFNTELVTSYGVDPRVTIPSQREEHDLGYDAKHVVLPEFINSMNGTGTITATNTRCVTCNQFHNNINNIPNTYSANLFIQFKKPEYLTTSQSKQYYIFQNSYYRYTLYQEQLNTLLGLNNSLINDNTPAKIIYASPAASDLNELHEQATQREVVEKSSIAEVSTLVGHNHVAYRDNTMYVGCSEPQEYNSKTLKKHLERIETETNLNETYKSMEVFLEKYDNLSYSFYKKHISAVNELELSPKEKQIFSIEWIANYLGVKWTIIT
ncbi:hypothetical protein [Mammaliicoccus fleurettii]|uniref:hypothetical protein n=1 Tax=Mammaliicoccus fleurettii TaxID=150056 RepID=UPI000DFD82D8|nr:hypothetical protein [Mammaliicoccus fleurettii]RTX91634.1 hypothetical protein CD129_00865 [Mammaliicoccus fleurettii]SUN01380.1 Uncharacterised protein [Mammaliicoccus fleurettii]